MISNDELSGPIDPYENNIVNRLEHIDTTSKTYPRGARHGSRGKFVINDTKLYDFIKSRLADYTNRTIVDSQKRLYHILTESFEYPNKHETEQYAVTACKSNWKAGFFHENKYRPAQKYTFTVRSIDKKGSPQLDYTPCRSLSFTVVPQFNDLVYENNKEVHIPHDEGCLINVQTTWINHPHEFVDQVSNLLKQVFDYNINKKEINEESKAFSGAEVYHRVSEKVENDLVATIRQTTDLLAQEDAVVNSKADYSDVWNFVVVKSREWKNLGFVDLDVSVKIKYYHPIYNDRDNQISDPKVEASLCGKEKIEAKGGGKQSRMIPWSRWDEIMILLDEVLLSHLDWADVSKGHLRQDWYSDGKNNPLIKFKHPNGRIEKLREYFDNLNTEIYRQVLEPRTDLVKDILTAMCEGGSLSYKDLVNKTGASKRTIRGHIKNLCEIGGKNPGILTKFRGAITFVNFSCKKIKQDTHQILQEIKTRQGDTKSDYNNRANTRVIKHLISIGLSRSDAEKITMAVKNSTYYEYSYLRKIKDPADIGEIVDDLNVEINYCKYKS